MTNETCRKTLGVLGTVSIITGLVILILAFTGCVTAIKSDKIIAQKTRFFGLMVGASPTTQTPEVKVGWGSVTWLLAPTSTNGPVSAPRYFDTFELGQSINPFSTAINENTGIGDVQVSTNAQGQAIIPKVPAPVTVLRPPNAPR